MVRSIEARKRATKKWRLNNPLFYRTYSLFGNCKERAKKKNLDFTLKREDIIVPEYCPILYIKLEHGFDSGRDNSPSVDRINIDRGYTRDNIQVISNLANRMKNNATLEQCILLGKWAEKRLIELPS